MGKHLSEDEIKYIVSAETAEAQQNIHKLTQENKSLAKEERARKNQMVELEAQGKKNTQEYKNLAAEASNYSDKIGANKKAISELTSKMDVNALSMNQLKKRAKELQSQLDGTVEALNPKEYSNTAAELEKVKSRMGELRGNGKAVNEEFDLNASLMSKMKAAAVAFISVKLVEYLGAIGMKAYETRKEFAKYEAILTHTLGSQEKSHTAMKMLQQIAKDSPGSLSEWTEGFIKLVNRGINPTKAQLINIGDIASNLGKSTDQFIEALLDSLSGENERLKEFGITANKTGDTTKYTFKGVTTEVQNTDAAITKYILSLGNLKGVQGSMAIQMNQLEGMESNFGDTMDSLFNKIGKRLEPFFKSILSSSSKFIQDLGDAVEPITDQFSDQFDKVVELEGSLSPLAERYDELTSKGNLTKQEHIELNAVINSIASAVPSAITAWDKYGNAIGISTGKVYEFINAEKARLRWVWKADIAKLQEQKRNIQKELTDDKINKYVYPNIVEHAGSYGQTSTYRKRTAEEEAELNKRISQNSADLAGIDAQLAKLTGDDIDRIVKRQVTENKAQTKARNEFMSMNKAKLSAWLKDEKNAASKYKDIAQEVYNSQFGGSPRGGKGKKDKTDYNAIALKNMDTLHEEQLNKIKLLGAEKEQTEDEINKLIIKSDISYYSQRISKLESFIKTTKDKKKKAAYENEVVNLKTKQINDEVTLEKQKVSNLEKIRQDDLSDQDKIYKANQASLENSLAEKKITKDQYDMMTLSLDVANTENRLQVEKQYLNDVNSLELKNGAIKADAVDKANEAVMSADLANAKARSAQQQKINDLVKDFKSEFKLTTVGEDLAMQMKVLDSRYQASKEAAIKAHLDTAELDKSYAQAKENLTQESESKINQVRNQYGLLNQKQQFDLELQQLKQHLNDQTLTQEEYEKAVQNLKRDSYKKQFDYYSGLFSGAINALQQSEMDNVDAKYDAEIEAAKGNSEEVERLENEKAQKKLDIEKKYADVNFAVKASQIIADTAVSIMKALGELGPIAGPIAAAMMGVTGAAQLASANAEREKVKNMTLAGTSSSSSSSTVIASGRENGGSIDIVRAQDGKLFPGASYDPNARGYIDKPTVIVGEGPRGQSREWVASNAALANPTVAPLIDIIDKSQRAGTIRTLDLNGVIRAKAAGYDKGGYIDNSVSGNNTPIINSGSNIPVALIEKLTTVLSSLDNNGITAGVYLTELERKQALRDKSKSIGSKR